MGPWRTTFMKTAVVLQKKADASPAAREDTAAGVRCSFAIFKATLLPPGWNPHDAIHHLLKFPNCAANLFRCIKSNSQVSWVQRSRFKAVVALVALAVFLFASGSRVLQSHASDASHTISRATIGDHPVNLESPGLLAVVHAPTVITITVCGRIHLSTLKAPSIFEVPGNFVRPPPSVLL